MVANLPQGKAASEIAEQQLRAAAEKAQSVKDALMLAVDEDTSSSMCTLSHRPGMRRGGRCMGRLALRKSRAMPLADL